MVLIVARSIAYLSLLAYPNQHLGDWAVTFVNGPPGLLRMSSFFLKIWQVCLQHT